MAFSDQFVNPTDATASNVITEIRNALGGAGWTNAANIYSSTVGGTTLTVNMQATAFDANGNYPVYLNGVQHFISFGHALTASTAVSFQYAVFNDVFWWRVTGTNAGNRANSYGSPSSSVFLSRYVPISSEVQTDASKHWVAIGFRSALPVHNEAGTPWASADVVHGYQGSSSNEIGELVTMRPAIQDIPNVGDLLPSKAFLGGVVYWPYGIVNPAFGYVGRIRNAFFGGETYTLTGDTTLNYHNDVEVYVNGKKYRTTVPYAYPTTSAVAQPYSAWGTCGGANNASHAASNPLPTRPGGPYIIVRAEA
jgi:hypothetical protein